jgi:uncharacterized protein (TIGR02246 family)
LTYAAGLTAQPSNPLADEVVMNASNELLLTVLNRYKSAVLAKDVDAFVALYDDDVHVFDMWGSWSLRGIDAWRNMATGWFASLGTERVVVGIELVEGFVADDLAVGHAILSYTAVSATGESLRSLNNRITVTLRKTGESWKIFHEHTSAPIDHETTKATLQYRNPG